MAFRSFSKLRLFTSESKDPEGNRVWCDPFNLGWMGRMIGVKDVMKDLNLGDGYDDEEEK